MPEISNDLETGSPAPAFQLTASDGSEVSLAQFKGKKAVALFFVREYN